MFNLIDQSTSSLACLPDCLPKPYTLHYVTLIEDIRAYQDKPGKRAGARTELGHRGDRSNATDTH
jgi:hypothetical protein